MKLERQKEILNLFKRKEYSITKDNKLISYSRMKNMVLKERPTPQGEKFFFTLSPYYSVGAHTKDLVYLFHKGLFNPEMKIIHKDGNSSNFDIDNLKPAKICSDCKEDKPIENFPYKTYRKDGSKNRKACCRECLSKQRKEWNKNNPERQKKNNKKIRMRCKSYSADLADTYIISMLVSRSSLLTKDIRKYPELIEARRQIIKISRLNKQKKDEQYNTTEKGSD